MPYSPTKFNTLKFELLKQAVSYDLNLLNIRTIFINELNKIEAIDNIISHTLNKTIKEMKAQSISEEDI